MIYCLIQTIDSGRWRWWAGFAASEFALLYAYSGCLYMLVIANFCGAVALLLRHGTWDARSQHLARLVVVSTVAGMIYLQLMLPCLPQLIVRHSLQPMREAVLITCPSLDPTIPARKPS
jgi:hypothetical protein